MADHSIDVPHTDGLIEIVSFQKKQERTKGRKEGRKKRGSGGELMNKKTKAVEVDAEAVVVMDMIEKRKERKRRSRRKKRRKEEEGKKKRRRRRA